MSADAGGRMTRAAVTCVLLGVAVATAPAGCGEVAENPPAASDAGDANDWGSLSSYADHFPASCGALDALVDFAYANKTCSADGDCVHAGACAEIREHCSGGFYLNAQHDTAKLGGRCRKTRAAVPIESPVFAARCPAGRGAAGTGAAFRRSSPRDGRQVPARSKRGGAGVPGLAKAALRPSRGRPRGYFARRAVLPDRVSRPPPLRRASRPGRAEAAASGTAEARRRRSPARCSGTAARPSRSWSPRAPPTPRPSAAGGAPRSCRDRSPHTSGDHRRAFCPLTGTWSAR
jgi:hypothetical protein